MTRLHEEDCSVCLSCPNKPTITADGGEEVARDFIVARGHGAVLLESGEEMFAHHFLHPPVSFAMPMSVMGDWMVSKCFYNGHMNTPAWLYEQFDPTGSAIGFRIREKLAKVRSPFQTIEIYQSTDWGRVMLIDGAMMLTSRDNFFYHEMMAHPALFTHPDPKRVVIIGGGDCGTLREVLKHPGVTQVIQCDIDEQVTRMSEQYFPELCESNHDPRARLLFDDGIAYMRNLEANSVDVVIVDSTDPIGPAEGLFNQAFFARCHHALKPDGILVQQSESPLALLELIGQMRTEMGKAGFQCFQTLPFPQPCYPTGWWSCTMARKAADAGFMFREHDAGCKTFFTRYYSAAIHRAAQVLPPFAAEALGVVRD